MATVQSSIVMGTAAFLTSSSSSSSSVQQSAAAAGELAPRDEAATKVKEVATILRTLQPHLPAKIGSLVVGYILDIRELYQSTCKDEDKEVLIPLLKDQAEIALKMGNLEDAKKNFIIVLNQSVDCYIKFLGMLNVSQTAFSSGILGFFASMSALIQGKELMENLLQAFAGLRTIIQKTGDAELEDAVFAKLNIFVEACLALPIPKDQRPRIHQGLVEIAKQSGSARENSELAKIVGAIEKRLNSSE